MKSIYIIGSLRNPEIPLLGNDLRKLGLDVFDDWFSSSNRGVASEGCAFFPI